MPAPLTSATRLGSYACEDQMRAQVETALDSFVNTLAETFILNSGSVGMIHSIHS